MDVDHPVNNGFAVLVELIEQFVAREDPARRAHEGVQQLVFADREVNRLAVQGDLVHQVVEDQGPVLQHFFLGWLHRVGATEDCLDPFDQFPGAERFDHIIIRTDGQAHDPVDFLFPGSEHQDGHVGGLADAAAYLPAVDSGQHDI